MLGTPSFPLTTLPPELQREIFICAADGDPKNATRLVLVARRINAWVQPRIYRLVSLGASDVGLFIRTMDVKPKWFFASNVKQLCLTASLNVQEATRILQHCTGVVNLALWVDLLGGGKLQRGSVAPLIASLPLRRLSIEYGHLLDIYYTPTRPVPSWYRTLTHLDLIFWSVQRAPPLPFSDGLDSLTHLSLGFRHAEIAEEYLTSILASFQRLQILLVLHDELDDPDDFAGPTDIRVIYMAYPVNAVVEWEANWMEKSNVWSKAEEELEQRKEAAKSRAGSFDSTPKVLPHE